MFNKLSGDRGEVWIGKSCQAASLTSWTAIRGEHDRTSWEFVGRLGQRDDYYITQAPNTVRLPLGNTGRQLRWTGVLEIEGDNVRATFVGPPEERG